MDFVGYDDFEIGSTLFPFTALEVKLHLIGTPGVSRQTTDKCLEQRRGLSEGPGNCPGDSIFVAAEEIERTLDRARALAEEDHELDSVEFLSERNLDLPTNHETFGRTIVALIEGCSSAVVTYMK
jgi:hypothetical protein